MRLNIVERGIMFFREIYYDDGPDFGDRLRDQLQVTKLVHVKGVPDKIDRNAFYEEVSARIGRFVDSDENAVSGEKTGRVWTDVKYDPDQEQHFRHSKTAQPLHTDSAYDSQSVDVVFFYCVRQARSGGETIFLDSFDLIYYLSHECPALLDNLQNVPVSFTKGTGGKEKPPLTWDRLGPVLTWNYYRASSQTTRGRALIESFHSFLQEQIIGEGRAFPLRLMPGEAVFFQDERLLHGRNAFIASDPGERLFCKGGLVYQ
jgi:alpha-ketoglutarate-dependent taurine dioxygenase